MYTRTSGFGYRSASEVIGASRSANEIYLSKQFKHALGVHEAVSSTAGLGGMTLSVHHSFDDTAMSFKADGSKQDRQVLAGMIIQFGWWCLLY